jgi:hypothetical protein
MVRCFHDARRIRAMASAVSLRGDYSATELRRLAAVTKNANQSRRLLSLAAVLDGMNRTEAARIGGMDRQTLRDWVHRFNEHGPEGLVGAKGVRSGSVASPATTVSIRRASLASASES